MPPKWSAKSHTGAIEKQNFIKSINDELSSDLGSNVNFRSVGTLASTVSGNLIVGKTLTGSIAEFRVWNQSLSASRFKQHILDNPDTYIGSVENVDAQMWVYDDESNKIVLRDIEYKYPHLVSKNNKLIVNVIIILTMTILLSSVKSSNNTISTSGISPTTTSA